MRFLELLWNLLHGCGNRRWKLCSILERFGNNIQKILSDQTHGCLVGKCRITTSCVFFQNIILNCTFQFCGRYALFSATAIYIANKTDAGALIVMDVDTLPRSMPSNKISISAKESIRYTYFTNFAFCNCIVRS